MRVEKFEELWEKSSQEWYKDAHITVDGAKRPVSDFARSRSAMAQRSTRDTKSSKRSSNASILRFRARSSISISVPQ